MIVRKRLLLEYNRSSQTIGAIEWGYGETETFSYETNWYIGTIARENWSSIHVEFFTVDGVSFFADGHHEFSVANNVGDRLSILIPIYSCAKCFTEYAEWNHGSPSAVNVRSSITFDNVVVYNIVGGTNSHNNTAVSIEIFSTNSVFQSTSIDRTVYSINCNNDIYSSFFISIDVQGTFTVLHSIFCSAGIERYLCILVALICNKCIQRASNASNIAIFVNDRYSYFVISIYFTFSWIESEAVFTVRINKSQIFFDKSLLASVKYLDSDDRTKQCLIGEIIYCGIEIAVSSVDSVEYFVIALEANLNIGCRDLQTIFINIYSSSLNLLAKSYLIGNSICITDWIIVLIYVNCCKIKIYFLSLAIFSCSKGRSCIFPTFKCNTNNIFTWNKIFLCFFYTLIVFQSVVLTIPNE